MPEPEAKKTRNFRSLTFTLAVSFLFLSLILLMITTGMDTYFNFKSHQKLIAEQQQLIAKEAANEVRGFVQEKFNVLEEASSVGDLAVSDQKKQKLVLEKLLGLEPSFRQLIVLDLQGEETARVSRLSNLMSSQLTIHDKEELFSKVKEGKQYIGSVYIDETTSEPMVIMAVPVTNIFHDVKGTLMAEVNLKFMWDLVGRIKVGNNGLAYVVDRKGNLIAYGDISRVLKGENLAHLEEVGEFVNGKESAVEGKAHISKGIQSATVVSNYVSLGLPEWAVVVELPVLEAYKTTVTLLELTLLSLIASLVLATLLGIYLSKRITKPIIRLRDVVVKIGEGNLDAQIEIQSNDEIGELSSAFSQMTVDLKKSHETIKKHAEELEKKVEERTKELKEKNEELEKFNKMVIGRELKMVELKGIIKEVEEKLQNSTKQVK